MQGKPTPPPEHAPRKPFYCKDSYEPGQSIGYLMRCVLSNMAHAIDDELAHTGLTNAQWLPLYLLAHGRADTAAALARESGLDAGSTTRMLDRLEQKGLCQRHRSDTDRRVVLLALTREGKQAARQIPVALSRVNNQALEGFSHEEWEILKNLLQRMLDNSRARPATTGV
jgi:DNA-binding MarR family transcriptional regulator